MSTKTLWKPRIIVAKRITLDGRSKFFPLWLVIRRWCRGKDCWIYARYDSKRIGELTR